MAVSVKPHQPVATTITNRIITKIPSPLRAKMIRTYNEQKVK
jgi:hypothetical protein